MDAVLMFHQTMTHFARHPEWPKSMLLAHPLAKTAPLGQDAPAVSVQNVDVFDLVASLTGHIGVMNFASPVNPGGGVEVGAMAQEESLAKGTYLVPALRQFETSYYALNRRDPNRGLFSPALIYSDRVRQLFDGQGHRLSGHYLDIVTVAAPDRRHFPHLTDAEALADISVKCLQTLRAFKAHGVTVAVLGAFGTGVFENPVAPVAAIWRDLLTRVEFGGAFAQVIFAVFDRQGDTFLTFQSILAH